MSKFPPQKGKDKVVDNDISNRKLFRSIDIDTELVEYIKSEGLCMMRSRKHKKDTVGW